MDQAKIDRPDRPRLSSRCTWSTDTSTGFVYVPLARGENVMLLTRAL